MRAGRFLRAGAGCPLGAGARRLFRAPSRCPFGARKLFGARGRADRSGATRVDATGTTGYATRPPGAYRSGRVPSYATAVTRTCCALDVLSGSLARVVARTALGAAVGAGRGAVGAAVRGGGRGAARAGPRAVVHGATCGGT
ncbi:hypothetical protein [Streptomyces sp. G45]|uniref:hypothetical protein n=1 Tax=Streptomyces sp. G45 TaxID=3406627 RepID=UPI003C1F95BD